MGLYYNRKQMGGGEVPEVISILPKRWTPLKGLRMIRKPIASEPNPRWMDFSSSTGIRYVSLRAGRFLGSALQSAGRDFLGAQRARSGSVVLGEIGRRAS